MTQVPSDFSWPASWKPLPLPEGWPGLIPSAEVELQSELCPEHPLFGVACRAVAFNADNENEFLFATDNPTTPLAFVHLTFQAESDPKWPYPVSYSGWEEFRAAWKSENVQMAFTREEAYVVLCSLKPAPVFLQSYREKRLPEDLEIYFGPPEEFFLAPETQEMYTQNRLVPILDDGNFGTVTFLDPDTRELVQVIVEAPDEPPVVFRHWQQYLGDLMIRVGESEDDDDRVRRIAELVGFRHTDALFDHFARTESLTGDAQWEARRQFPLSLPADPGASAGPRS